MCLCAAQLVVGNDVEVVEAAQLASQPLYDDVLVVGLVEEALYHDHLILAELDDIGEAADEFRVAWDGVYAVTLLDTEVGPLEEFEVVVEVAFLQPQFPAEVVNCQLAVLCQEEEQLELL